MLTNSQIIANKQHRRDWARGLITFFSNSTLVTPP